MVTVLVDNEHLKVEEHSERKVVVVARSAVPAPTDALVGIYEDAIAVMRPEHRSWGLVLDIRAAPGRNDPAFESAVADVRHKAERYFARVVVLVGTAAGELQVRRLGREDGGLMVLIARDPDEALALAAG